MNDYSGKALEARIRALEERVSRLEPVRAVTPPSMEKMVVDTSRPTWSEAHREPEEPAGTVKPYIRPDGMTSDTMVLIKKERGWETAMVNTLDEAPAWIATDNAGPESPAARESHLADGQGQALDDRRQGVEPQP